MSKSTFNTVLETNIKDNNNKFITPARHRTVLTTLRDLIGWLAEINTWTALNYFQGGTRNATSSTGTGTVTLDTDNQYAAPSGVTQVNLKSSPSNGQWYEIKNRSGGDVTLSGNGILLYTSSTKASITLIHGQSTRVWYDGTYYNVV